MPTDNTDHAIAYAIQRRRETGKAYIVSSFGRCIYDCAFNRRLLAELGETIVFRS